MVEAFFAGISEERDRRRAFDPERENLDPPDSDPLFNGLEGEPRWRLFADTVNHSSIAWYVFRRTTDDLL